LQTIEEDLKTQNIVLSSPQPGVSHIDVPAGIVSRKPLYSGRSQPLDDDDDDAEIYLENI